MTHTLEFSSSSLETRLFAEVCLELDKRLNINDFRIQMGDFERHRKVVITFESEFEPAEVMDAIKGRVKELLFMGFGACHITHHQLSTVSPA